MNTTSLFIELLIVGIQACFWIILLVISFWGYNWIYDIRLELNYWINLLTIALLTFCYTFGIIIDRIAVIILNTLDPIIYSYFMKFTFISSKLELSVDKSEIEIHNKTNKIPEYIQFYNSRLRVLRGTSINLIFFIISAVVFVSFRNEFIFQTKFLIKIIFIIFFGFILLLPTISSYLILNLIYTTRLDQIKEVLGVGKSDTSP
jgi:hypothetical protein